MLGLSMGLYSGKSSLAQGAKTSVPVKLSLDWHNVQGKEAGGGEVVG